MGCECIQNYLKTDKGVEDESIHFVNSSKHNSQQMKRQNHEDTDLNQSKKEKICEFKTAHSILDTSSNIKRMGSRKISHDKDSKKEESRISMSTNVHTPINESDIDDPMKKIDPKMAELINNEIIVTCSEVKWSDISGLEFAKKTLKEIVIWPMLRPDIFKGIRGPPKGILLFGPPGTGKTLIGKCIASQSKSTFFSISASSLTSKWIGEGEKMVRALFVVASFRRPSVIFIDEIDALLSQRSDGEHESSRRIKTEFLIQLDGVNSKDSDRILLIGATNRPQEIDEAARRRFTKRLYIPLPEKNARQKIVLNMMKSQGCFLDDEQIDDIGERSKGFSGADVTSLCREAALGPIRIIDSQNIESIKLNQVRNIQYSDFNDAFDYVKSSVSGHDLARYEEWNSQFGSWQS